MSSGFYSVSGVMYINMGCEIIFVLINRMKAQKIDMSTVGTKILNDITLLMFKPSFISSILKPQIPLSIPVLYDVFTKIVNSSLMKLDKNSMQKLFYLILMTFKKQVFTLSSPLQLFTLTLTHLQDIISLQKQSPKVQQCLQQCLRCWCQQSEKYSYIHYLDFKQQILSMLQTYKSRIVLFCETGSQQQNGCLIFQPRNSHNRKNVGVGQNHPDIDFPQFYEWNQAKNLQYSNFRDWKTVLGKDDYDNTRGSSKVIESKIKKQLKQQSSKSIADILGVKNMKLDSYEVYLDLFSNQKPQKNSEPKANENIKTVEAKTENDIRKLIDKQFSSLQIQSKENQQIDLLQLMDS